MTEGLKRTHYRAIWVSDTHLGKPGAKAEVLVSFLQHNTADHLYLVGDVVDFWALARRVYFPRNHVDAVRQLFRAHSMGTRITYVVGNHDEMLRRVIPFQIGEINVVNEAIHETSSGRRYLVIHGDQFDQITRYARWMAIMGDVGYEFLLRLNSLVHLVRWHLGMGHWSLSAFVKRNVKRAVNFIGHYEEAVVKYVQGQGLDGVICGHIHTADLKPMGGIEYVNCGDWVESCTAVVERDDGSLEIVTWPVSVRS